MTVLSAPTAAIPILIIFARNPVVGQVKTRLVPALGERGAMQVHMLLLQRTLEAAAALQGVGVELWTDTSSPAVELRELAERFSLPVYQQQGADLGAKMEHAFDSALTRSPYAVLIGSDCPDWQVDDFVSAFDGLHDADAVIGPALDGGYVLLGLQRTHSSLFHAIPWGGDEVLQVTKNRLQALGWRLTELSAHPDIDRPEDLSRLHSVSNLSRKFHAAAN